MQKDDPEEDMDTRGGGQAADDRRIVKEEDYASDNDADFMEDDKAQAHQKAQHAQQPAGFQTDSRSVTPGRASMVGSNMTTCIPTCTLTICSFFVSLTFWSSHRKCNSYKDCAWFESNELRKIQVGVSACTAWTRVNSLSEPLSDLLHWAVDMCNAEMSLPMANYSLNLCFFVTCLPCCNIS